MRLGLVPLAFAAVLSLPRAASAFCGFYAAGAGTKVFNNATMVVLLRDGTRTVLSMQNNYQGPPEGFAMVVPVPVVLQKENVKTLPREVFDRIDQLAAPRLVEYWERDPCANPATDPWGGPGGAGVGFGGGIGRLGGGGGGVAVLAEFAVGEYEIVILGAKQSTGLDAWLREHGYGIPDGAEPLLRPYVASGMFFFVARVDPAKVRFENGMATLSPLRFHYDSPTFTLPVRLGLLSSPGTQDLIVHTLAMHQRYEVANYPNAFIPTNLDVTEKTKDAFGAFYAALFDRTVADGKGAVVTEYAWDAGSCDPCPVPALDAEEVATLGGDVSTSARPMGMLQVRVRAPTLSQRGLPVEVVHRIVRWNGGGIRLCYEHAKPKAPKTEAAIKLTIGAKGELSGVSVAKLEPPEPALGRCLVDSLRALSFPKPENGPLEATVPISFNAAGGVSPAGLVLTRLHVRYGKDALGQDLVFKEAPAVTGGREGWADGKLEKRAVPAETNTFQARYAIRHAWEGPIACADPRRGNWLGAPPKKADPDAGRTEDPAAGAATKPIVARDLAFAPRGGVTLADFVATAAAAEPPKADPAPAPSAAPEPEAKRGCSACAVGGDAEGRGGLVGLALAALVALVTMARRTRRAGA